MRRPLAFIAIILALGLTVTVSAKTVQERRAERLARRQQISSLSHSLRSGSGQAASSASSVSSASIKTPIINKQDLHYAIPLLVYHHIRPTAGYDKSTWSWKMSVSPKVFAAQMQWLADHRYTPVTLDTFLRIANGEILGPEKPVVITFDDSNRSQYDVALPILEEHRFTAVFYLITKSLASSAAINTEMAKDLAARGMDIQSHTLNHLQLTRLTQKELDWELAESRRILEELTGKPVRHVAYPATMQNALVRERAAAAGYVTGTLMDPRRATEKDDFLRIPRIMMTDETSLQKILP